MLRVATVTIKVRTGRFGALLSVFISRLFILMDVVSGLTLSPDLLPASPSAPCKLFHVDAHHL